MKNYFPIFATLLHLDLYLQHYCIYKIFHLKKRKYEI